ncbi:laminin subunit beta-1-like isoform X2 [Ptychodera flava]|uniref:laminin subunit beta-1-like isoform X2 n=1 Tax=Ptychodera flava TaxID=63121 RepID=UPI003969F577
MRCLQTFVIFVALLVSMVAVAQDNTDTGECINKACYPPFEDLILPEYTNRTVFVSSTCGDPPNNYYLATVDENDDQTLEYLTCNASDPDSMHPAEYLHDMDGDTSNLDTWWQSINQPNDTQLTLSLNDEFLLQQMVISFRSARPLSMYVETSTDNGTTWKILQYYADDCASRFPGIPIADLVEQQMVLQPTCIEAYFLGDDVTRVPGNIQQVIYNPAYLFGEVYFTFEAEQYFLATDIRATLAVPPFLTDAERSFFAVADWEVSGQCICFGHAEECTGENGADCVCQHNTMGKNCEECMPLYNNKPWLAGVDTDANACEDCGCNGHASSCIYDEIKQYGVCQDCTDNTTGDKCEMCLPSFFKNPFAFPGINETCIDSEVTFPCNQSCISCNCSDAGTVANTYCNQTSGECQCKEFVEGRACDVCKDTFWNLDANNPLGCEPCSCFEDGSKDTSNFCDKITGQCICKANTQGSICDECKPGTFNLQPSNPDGCTLCGCDPGGSLDPICDPGSGQCQCRGNNIAGRACDTADPGYFVPKLDGIMEEAELATYSGPVVIEEMPAVDQGGLSTGSGYLVVSENSVVTFSGMTVPRSQNYEVVLRYYSESLWTSVTVTFTQQNPDSYECGGNTLTNAPQSELGSLEIVDVGGSKAFGALCLRGDSPYDVTVTVTTPTQTGSNLKLDSLVLLPSLGDIDIFTSENTTDEDKALMGQCWNAVSDFNPEERQNLSCSKWEFSLMAEVFDGAIACSCNGAGTVPNTVCDPQGGQCQCMDNVITRQCDNCAAYHYGYESGQGCTACGCDEQGSVSLTCDQTTGVCTCKLNVNGTKCDVCDTEFYGLYLGGGCMPCTCDMTYSLNNECADSGQCDCKPGIGGQDCVECLSGYFNLTTDGCTSCGCAPDGTASDGCDVTTGECSCKTATMGDKCDICKETYYGFGPWNSDGCIPCTCSGHSTNCTTSESYNYFNLYTDWSLLDEVAVAPRWSGTTSIMNGTDVPVDDNPVVEGDLSRFVLEITDPVNNTDELFFVSSDPYNGDKRTAYGQVFTFTISQSQLGNQTTSAEGDVFIYGSYADQPLVASLPFSPNTTATTYSYTLNEIDGSWHHGSVSGQLATFNEFYRVLSGIDSIYIRAKYTSTPEQKSYLYAVGLEFSTDNVTLSNITIDNVEQCACPPEYTGNFCEHCALTFTRADPSAGPFSECVPCDCNGHSDMGCDPDTGVCIDCIHNTAGDKCDVCLPGYYGDATLGTPDDCQPCMCPGPAGQNSFSDTCVLDSTVVNGYTCDSCAEGHGGNRCQVCETGYYGTPEEYSNEGGICQPCFCNLSPDECNSVTGQCNDCWNNTEGLHCEVCEFGYWGSIENCQECDCDHIGGYGNCSQDTGICLCKPNVVGDRCTECAARSWGFESGDGCTECDCHLIGTQPGQWQCNLTNGQCDCKERAIGLQCNQCIDGYYDIDLECIPCGCNLNGSIGISCELETGQCYCNKPTIAGRVCDQCGRVGDDENEYVDEVFTGPWPDCSPCPECFHNWADSIQEVGDQLQSQYDITVDLLSNYNNMSVEVVDATIQYIRGNLSYAEQVMADAMMESVELAEIQQGFEKIIYEVGNFSEMLDIIEDKEVNVTQRLTGVSSYTGNVEVETGVFKTAQQIQTELASPLATQETLFQAANGSWFSIQDMYNAVAGSNTRVQSLVNEVQSLLRTVELVAMDRGAATTLINNDVLQDEYESNTELLASVDTIQQAYPVSEVQSKVDQAYAEAVSANTSANLANQLGRVRKQEAEAKLYQSQIARYNSTNSASAAMRAQTAALTYKSVALYTKGNMTSHYEDVLDAYSQLLNAENQTTQMQSMNTEVIGKSIRPVSDMTALAGQITSTDISEQAVLDTLEQAQNTLDAAIGALNNSLEAEVDAQAALELVQGIQNTLQEADNLRTATQESMNGTDANATNIHRIADEVQAKGIEQNQLGLDTADNIALIRGNIVSTDDCFSDKVTQAENAVSRANQAEADANEAVTAYTNNAERQSDINSQVTSAYSSGMTQYQQVRSVSDSARQLKQDIDQVKMMEDLNTLLLRYINQRTSMEIMKAQMDKMNDDLDNLLANLESSDASDIQCNNG